MHILNVFKIEHINQPVRFFKLYASGMTACHSRFILVIITFRNGYSSCILTSILQISGNVDNHQVTPSLHVWIYPDLIHISCLFVDMRELEPLYYLWFCKAPCISDSTIVRFMYPHPNRFITSHYLKVEPAHHGLCSGVCRIQQEDGIKFLPHPNMIIIAYFHNTCSHSVSDIVLVQNKFYVLY